MIRGEFFYLEDGTPFTVIESSEFSLFWRFLQGDDIDPVLQQRAALGFNMLRVWTLNTSVIPGSGLQPKQYPGFYESLALFLEHCAQFGLRVELTAFTQTQTLMPNVNEQRAHLERLNAVMRPAPNVIGELVNEYDAHDNACSPLLAKPDGVIWSRGSAGADHEPMRPSWDYELYHSNGLNEWQRKVGHNAMEFANSQNVPAFSNENTRIPDQDADPRHCFDAAQGAALLCSGSCFHSVSGKTSHLFTDQELALAQQWVAGARSVPLEFRTGKYHHRTDLETSADIIRGYDRTLPDGRKFEIVIHK